MTSQIVNLTDYRNNKTKENTVLSDEDLIQSASEIVLDSIAHNFDGGILIGVIGNKLQISSTLEDEQQTLQMLEEVLENLYKEMNYD